ncbi:hypothetical protein ENVG_00465 [Emiliania huxleyi virus 84]|nr:hypothetical protein ENVG_00465 [Emiliania huxleyi virus 84]
MACHHFIHHIPCIFFHIFTCMLIDCFFMNDLIIWKCFCKSLHLFCNLFNHLGNCAYVYVSTYSFLYGYVSCYINSTMTTTQHTNENSNYKQTPRVQSPSPNLGYATQSHQK